MSIIGNCIKTGAVVKFIEYNQTFVADLFQVDGAIVIHLPADAFNQELAFNHPRPVTHEVHVGKGLLDKRAGYAVVSADSIWQV